jgi:hypothetical protein
MTALKEAIKENKLKDFIAEHSKEELKGDKEKFDKTLKSITFQKKSINYNLF